MRISNLQFAKGSIVYARFTDELEHLNGRPLIVVSDHIPVYDCVWVVECGTRGKAGINISLFNYATKDFIGGQQITTIYPYNIYTVKVSQIISTIGVLDRRIMKKVDEAIDFFMGRSDNVPEFLSSFADEMTSVSYQPANMPYTRVDEGIGSDYDYTHSSTIYPVQQPSGENAWNVPTPAASTPNTEFTTGGGNVEVLGVVSQAGTSKAVPKKEIPTKDITEDKVAEFLTLRCNFGPKYQTPVRLLTDEYNRWADVDVSVIGFSRTLNNYLTKINSKAKKIRVNGVSVFSGIRIGIGEEDPGLPPANFELFSVRDRNSIRSWATMHRIKLPNVHSAPDVINLIGDESSIIIASRQASVGAIQIKYGLTTEDAQAVQDIVLKTAATIGNDIISRVMKNNLNIDTLSEFEKVSVVLAGKIYGFCSSPRVRVKLNKLFQDTMKTYRIDFQEKAIWSDVITY